MAHETKHGSHNESSRNVTIADVFARIWVKKIELIIWIVVGIGVGITIARSLPPEYTASMCMVPEDTKSNSSQMSALQALGMGSAVSTDDAYTPSIYPDIVGSIPFTTQLFDVEVQTNASDSTFTLRDYMENKIKHPWWTKTLADLNIKSDEEEEESLKAGNDLVDPFHLTDDELSMYFVIKRRIKIVVDKRTAQVNIFVTMQDPLVAAQLTDTVAARLQEYITDYRTAKARQDLDYALSINEEAKEQYYDAQTRYAEWMDRNQALATYEAQSERDRLENDMQLAFNLFNQTSQKVQSAESKVQEVTPVFAIVNPATVPLYPQAPRKRLITFVSFFIFTSSGLIRICFGLFCSRAFRQRVRDKIKRYRKNRKKRKSGEKESETPDAANPEVVDIEIDNYIIEEDNDSNAKTGENEHTDKQE